MLTGPLFPELDIADTAFRHYKGKYDEAIDQEFLPRRKIENATTYVVDKPLLSVGMARMQAAEQMLESAFSLKRFHFDRQIHDAAIRAMTPVFLGDEWATLKNKILKERGWVKDGISKLVAAMGPRRMGKTVCMAKCIVVFGYIMLMMGGVEYGRKYTQTVFSTGKRASGGIRSHVMAFYAELGIDGLIIKNTAEQVILSADPSDPKAATVVVNFLPAGSTTYVFLFVFYFFAYFLFFLYRVVLVFYPFLLPLRGCPVLQLQLQFFGGFSFFSFFLAPSVPFVTLAKVPKNRYV